MQKYSIDDIVKISNKKLTKQLKIVVRQMMKKGVSAKEITQFFIATTELTLRMDDGTLQLPSEEKEVMDYDN